jgi:hypothetical protein
MKRCSICKSELPLESFRRRRRDSDDRHAQCSACKRNAERVRRTEAREKSHRKAIYAWATRMHRYRDAAPTMERISRLTTARLGGIEKVGAMVAAELVQALKDGAHTDAIRLMLAMFEGLRPADGASPRPRIRS